MMYALIAVMAALLITVLVYLRHFNRRQVASLFQSTVRELQAGGVETEQALHQTIDRFIRRPPFNLLKPNERTLFIHVLLDMGSPVDVGAEILQRCENKHSISEIRDIKQLTRLAYTTDLRLSLQQLIQNAKLLHRKVTDRYPNITIALLASLSVREGWTFVEEQNEDLIFDYRQERIRMPKQGSGKDAARLILFEEMTQRPMIGRPETDNLRRSSRRELVDSFDTLFEETFLGLGKAG